MDLQLTNIRRAMNWPYSAICASIETCQNSTTGISSPSLQTARDSDTDKQYIHFQIKRDFLMRTGDICKLLDKPVSVSTVAHVLKRYGYGCWNAQKTL